MATNQTSSASQATDEIPVLDLGPYRAGQEGALATLAAQLRNAFEHVGFYFISNHGVPQPLIDRIFAEAERIHALPLEEKLALKFNEHNLGYLPLQGGTTRHSDLNKDNKPNLNESFFVKRDLPADHPDVVSGKRFRGANKWPANLPGFRDTVNEYCKVMEALAKSLLPIYAVALDMAPDAFDAAFADPQYTLRLAHYPQQRPDVANEFGVAPHTDTSFMTLLAQNRIPGLSVRLQSGEWIDAPALEGTFLVNGGDMLRRWTNKRFLATPHRVINRSGRERYAIPFFFACSIDHVMECLPTCRDAENPPQFPPTTYMQYMTWYQSRNYDFLKPPTGAQLAGV